MSKHTPTQWKVYEHSVAGIHIESELKVGWGIAEIQTRADAEFIVDACNSHDALVEALECILKALCESCTGNKRCNSGQQRCCEYRMAKQVLAEAKETP